MKRGGLSLVGAGAAMLLIGLLLGLLPLTADGVDCGSGFYASEDAFLSDLTDSLAGKQGTAIATCDAERGTRQLIAGTLIVLGCISLAAGATVVGSSRSAPEHTPNP